MKFEVQRSDFLDALQTVSYAVPNKSTLQILNNFLLRLEGNFLEISATDLDLGISVKLEVNGSQNGDIVVNAAILLNLVKTQEELPLTFTVSENNVSLQSPSGYTANITGFEASEFPRFPEIHSDKELHVMNSELQYLSEKTLFAVSNDITRLSLNGVFCQLDGGKLIFVATDGHRLGKAFIEKEGESWAAGVIIPRKTLAFVSKVLPGDAEVDVKIDETHICFSNEKVQVVSKLIEGPYPNYQNVIPADFTKTCTFDRMDSIAKINRQAALANARTRQIKMHFETDQLTFSTSNQDVGGNSDESLLVSFEGEAPFDIGINANYLLEIIKMCPSDQVIIKMNTAVGATIIEPVGDGLDFFFLLMPLRLTE
ncbi:MAG: DNA polymerase III subunit beta [Fibrobacterales bacterium]